MSTDVSLAVITGGVFVIAAGWIGITRCPSQPSEPEPAVAWLRPRDHRTAHAFRAGELRATGRPRVETLAFCGRWPVASLVAVAELVADEDAPRCAACEWAVRRTVDRMEYRPL